MIERDEAVSLFARRDETPRLEAPWQAQAFSMTVKLYQGGHFNWSEWVERLGAEIGRAGERGEPDTEDTYYRCWLRALETLVSQKGLTSRAELVARREAWDRAARVTPHGEPIRLGADDS